MCDTIFWYLPRLRRDFLNLYTVFLSFNWTTLRHYFVSRWIILYIVAKRIGSWYTTITKQRTKNEFEKKCANMENSYGTSANERWRQSVRKRIKRNWNIFFQVMAWRRFLTALKKSLYLALYLNHSNEDPKWMIIFRTQDAYASASIVASRNYIRFVARAKIFFLSFYALINYTHLVILIIIYNPCDK